MHAAEAAWVSAVVLKPAPKAEETDLQFGFVSIFCYDMYVKKWKAKSFKIPEDPSQTLPGRSPMGPVLKFCFVKLSRILENNDFSRRSWPILA